MFKRRIIILCLLGAAILALLLWRSPPKELQELLSEPVARSQYPSSYIEEARTRQYDEMGQLSYTLDAKLIRYYDKAQSGEADTIIESPELTLFEKGTTNNGLSTTRVSADLAEANQTKDQLELTGNVVVQQQVSDGTISTLKTDSLFIQPNRRYAETDKPVIIVDPSGKTTATGLKMYFNERRIELLSNVKGTYAFK